MKCYINKTSKLPSYLVLIWLSVILNVIDASEQKTKDYRINHKWNMSKKNLYANVKINICQNLTKVGIKSDSVERGLMTGEILKSFMK